MSLDTQEINFLLACMETIEELPVGYEAVQGATSGEFGEDYWEFAAGVRKKT